MDINTTLVLVLAIVGLTLVGISFAAALTSRKKKDGDQ